MASNGSRKRVTGAVESTLGLDRNALQGLPLQAKRSSDGALVSLESLEGLTASDFASEGSSDVVSIPDACRSFSLRLASLEDGLAKQRVEIREMKDGYRVEIQEMKDGYRAEIQEMKVAYSARIDQLEARMGFLELDSSKYHQIIKRHVVEKVHAYLQRQFGAKDEAMQWDDYLATLFLTHKAWFSSNGLHLKDLGLLLVEKGSFTPFDQANRAAHDPPTATVDQVVEGLSSKKPAWRIWWQLVRDQQ
ncbi:hypothetical protein Vretimale_107 [Volvox reticuliferus]|nr:hypothetical protein Vretifemale_8301 [Volvox reticuliferus]GIL93878.1 hypothetical protein Vretimale_107 [Volvox reticuliferus]